LKQLSTRSESDLIIQYLQDPTGEFQLTDALKQTLHRLSRCADLIKQWGSRQKVVPMLMHEFDIGQAQAYRDFGDCQEVFGSTPRNSRDFYLDILIGHISETRQKALAKDDFKTAASCDKNMILVISEYFKNETIDWNKVQMPSVLIGFFPELSNVVVPDDWRQQIDRLLAKKRNSSHLPATDAEIISDDTTGKS
jgi:hypothetical protein